MAEQVKSKKRVADHGEVFTAEREVNAMLDLVKTETERIDSRFLEPACGNGNFLVEILKRKLAIVKKKYRRSPIDFEKNSILALSSVYGVDLLIDNVLECRERLYKIWYKEYKSVCKKEVNEDCEKSAHFILERNIVCGNALTLCCVDENGSDIEDKPIVFSEWAFITGLQMQRKDYSFADILQASEESDKIKESGQLSLFANKDDEVEPTLLTQYISNYRKIYNEDK